MRSSALQKTTVVIRVYVVRGPTRPRSIVIRLKQIIRNCLPVLWWLLNRSGRDFPSSGPLVVMMQPTKNGNSNDALIGL
jgi:hypothetical protein